MYRSSTRIICYTLLNLKHGKSERLQQGAFVSIGHDVTFWNGRWRWTIGDSRHHLHLSLGKLLKEVEAHDELLHQNSKTYKCFNF
jgi:hypothetical protein